MANSPSSENEHAQEGNHTTPPTTSTPPLPAAPDPSADPGVIPPIKSPAPEDESTPEELDIFVLTPVAALKMLCRSIDALVKLTGDVPPTPPVRSRAQSPAGNEAGQPANDHGQGKENYNLHPERGPSTDQIDGVHFTKTPIGSPEAHMSEPLHIVGAHAEPIYIQHGAIARKFYSKKPPPISTEEYLMRMHKYCPMSTAVYLATSVYITRMAVQDRVIPVTPRNVHRLLLAGLRVAMKALEDLSWPHGRFSKVGGVSEVELGRLEITFCFLMNFELKVDAKMLQQEVHFLAGSAVQDSPVSLEMKVPVKGGKRKASSALPSRSAAGPVALEAHS